MKMGQGGTVTRRMLDTLVIDDAVTGSFGPAPRAKPQAIKYMGNHFILPEGMTLDGAITFLEAKRDEEAGVVLKRVYDYRPWDGAAATARVLDEHYGGYAQHSNEGMFGARIPATKVSVPVSLTDSVTVPWAGKIAVAALPECVVEMNSATTDKGTVFQIQVMGPPSMQEAIEAMFDRVDAELEANSIYRGKAFDAADMPNFLDLSTIDPTKVVYSEEVLTQLDANVWSLLRYPETMRELGLPLKRSVLFEGPYGTGKTLAAYLTAREAVANGWTFIYCRPAVDDLLEALQTARLYEPCVVFFEDLDVIADVQDRDDETSELLDAFDGIENKNAGILAIITTNHVGQLHKGMLRPGRLDAVISIGALDRPGFEKLIRATVKSEHLDDEIDYDRLYHVADGMMPAFVREAVERTVRYAITRNQGEFKSLTTEDFEHSMIGMRPQLQLMDQAADERRVPTLEQAHGKLIADLVTPIVEAHLVPLYQEFGVYPGHRPGGSSHEKLLDHNRAQTRQSRDASSPNDDF